MVSVNCTIHLVALKSGAALNEALSKLEQDVSSSSYLLKGRVHGWVHRPHHNNTNELLAHDWDVFLLTREAALPDAFHDVAAAHLSVTVAVPEHQFDELDAFKGLAPSAIPSTPQLPNDWHNNGSIPPTSIMDRGNSPLRPGELRLDRTMADWLSTALPSGVANEPVSLMNLFKYPNGDSSTHGAYMEGFKRNFGGAAGATVKFMGPVKSRIQYSENSTGGTHNGESGTSSNTDLWQDANLVQYDTIQHYAYMLSTDVYAELNKQKMAGLEDTCILLVSEVELAQ